MSPSSRRVVHGVVGAVAVAAILWQLALVVSGASVLETAAQPGLVTRLARFVSYFTILSNLLVAGVSFALARDPARDGRRWRVVHLATLSSITVTGVVHWFFLRPILDLQGASYVVDKLLHVVVPVLAVVAWVVAGPRGRAVRAAILPSLGWPLLWGALTLARGAATGWWPYPFIDADTLGWGRVLLNLVAIAVLFAVVGGALVAVDRALAARQAPTERSGRSAD